MLNFVIAFYEVAGDNFVDISGTGNFETYEIATTDLHRLTRIY